MVQTSFINFIEYAGDPKRAWQGNANFSVTPTVLFVKTDGSSVATGTTASSSFLGQLGCKLLLSNFAINLPT